MGCMACLEWSLCAPGFVRNIIPIATSVRHSAWCISWGEAQRQSIYSDPKYEDGYYNASVEGQPMTGLGAARMAALLTYRSRDSFENRFGRRAHDAVVSSSSSQRSSRPTTPAETALQTHNDGHRHKSDSINSGLDELKEDTESQTPPRGDPSPAQRSRSPALSNSTDSLKSTADPLQAIRPIHTVFSAQSYLRYQGDKFVHRFDANCYIHLTRKMDTHDLARGRGAVLDEVTGERGPTTLAKALAQLPSKALVIGIESDGLFTTSEQREIAAHIPGATLVIIPSPDGHDG